jgi:hypothetical protein
MTISFILNKNNFKNLNFVHSKNTLKKYLKNNIYG